MLPLKDFNPTRRTAIVTLGLILVNVGVYFFVQPVGRATLTSNDQSSLNAEVRYTVEKAVIPKELVHGRALTEAEVADAYNDKGAVGVVCDVQIFQGGTFVYNGERACWPHKNVYLAALVSMFLHGSLLHLGGNMLFLWIFGNNIEDRFGRLKYALFYAIAGVVATGTYVLLNPSSETPLVGASGAIAGVMGAYLILFPKVRIRSLVFFLILDIPAVVWLLFWLGSQFLLNQEGVAWTAHVGGFIFGMLVGTAALAGGSRASAPPDPARY